MFAVLTWAAFGSSVGAPKLVVVENPADTTPPGVATSLTAEVTRGRGPVCVGTICEVTAGAEQGIVWVRFAPPSDDVSATPTLGYRARVVQGDGPDGDGWGLRASP